MKNQGWICVHREIFDNWIWQDKAPFDKRAAWIDLLLMANHKDNKILFDGELKEIKRGQRLTSIRKLCNRWKWSNTKVKNFLDLLEKDGMITLEIAPQKATLITIVNYSKYQDMSDSKSDSEASQGHQSSDSEASQEHINNNDNNGNNDKNDDVIGKILQDKILSEINILVSNQISSSRLNELISKFGIEPINILVEELSKSTWLKENITWNISQGFLDKVIAGDFRDYKEVKKTKTENQFNNFQGQSQDYTEEELNQMAKNIRKRRVASEQI